ncbi:MAG: hypothetical protein ACYSTS_07975 [Planctomycetota bacterium]
MKDTYPINVLNTIKNCQKVFSSFVLLQIQLKCHR